MSAEVAAINLGRVLATRAVSLWLAPRRCAQEADSSMADLIRFRVPGLRHQRGLERQFEDMADAVAARLEPLLAHEFRGLPDHERRAALDGVSDTFVRADLSDAAVIGADADPSEPARAIRGAVPAPAGLSEAAAAFHEALFAESVDCYVRILKHLPVFTERAVTELLARTTTLAAEVARALDRLPVRSLYAPEGAGEDEAFRREYLELISGTLDEVELQSLAASPLMAALLCALHLERRRQLPRSRMELYRTALEILLHRRDTERGVPGDLVVPLTLADKLLLLQDLAWRLSDNNRSEIARDRAAEHVRGAISAMRHLEGADGAAVLDHLLVRSGVLRAPAEDRVDFVHRSFQEYLAAAEAASEDRIGNLVEPGSR
ncbi:hypothetical protein AB0D46_04825 [Streptomyces sp. NPDC048383]|uniref:NACHT domain-containing protein n=1 Tax=Streptomyces sp. NPDC048383 TaxID=3155386 RepID=UPI003416704A